MARSKKQTISIKPPEKPKSTTSNSLVDSLLRKVGVSTDAEMLSKLNEDQKKSLLELSEQLETLIEDNKSSIKIFEDKSRKLDEDSEAFYTKKSEFDEQLNAIDEKKEALQKKQTTVLLKAKQTSDKEQELIEKEANAKAGFAIERQESLDNLKAQYKNIEDKIKKLESERVTADLKLLEEQSQLQEQLKIEEHKRFSSIRVKMNKDRIALEKEQLEMEKQVEENERLHIQLTNRIKDQLNTKKQEIEFARVEFQNDKTELENNIVTLTNYRERDAEKIKHLNEKLLSYKELEREAIIQELGTPKEVLIHLDLLKQQLKEVRSKLQGRTEDDLEEELEFYKEKAEELEDEISSLKQKYDEVRQRENKYKLSVREKLELQKQNDLLETSNSALTHSIDSIRSQLDDLIEKQQSQEAFRELLKMDREYNEKIPVQTVSSLKEFTEELQHRIAKSTRTELYYDLDIIRKFVAGLALSPLHIFQGISGTGKTSLVKAFANAVGGSVTTVPVQAGWRDRDDLIGHYNAFEKRYYEKECLQAIYRAHTEKYNNRFNIILLDEMNLSRPEQYFAEFLSAMEMDEGSKEIVLMDSSVSNPPKHFIDSRKIHLKSNTWFMGTANHDETTFEFADKTHDRAFTLDLDKQEKPENWKPRLCKSTTIDFDSVMLLFNEAEREYTADAKSILKKLINSNFTKQLEGQFDIGWGNRFEKQAIRFISVYMACGGRGPDALEHMLITRVLRKGKILGRYDISSEKLEVLNTSMETMFKSIGGTGDKAADILLSEMERKDQGIY